MDRQFEKSHPWLTFSADLKDATPEIWMLLGEASSKCEHIAGVPLRPEIAKQLHALYTAKGVRATTAIEGNTLSEEEVLRHLEGTLTLPPSKEYLARELDNVIAACNGIWAACQVNDPPKLTVEQIEAFNARILDGLEVESGVVPGEIRHHSVTVGRYRGAPPEDCEFLLQRLCDWLNGSQFDSRSGQETATAILKAVLAHLYLAWIHPFGDGNGRTARLVEFLILFCAGVPTPAAHLLSNHYNETRAEYYRQLDRASASGGDVVGFIAYAIRGLVDGLRGQILLIREQQLDVAWVNYVHEQFHDKDTEADRRRRRLVLDLSTKPEPVRYAELTQISPQVAAYYAHRTGRTLTRDLQILLQMGLITTTKLAKGQGWRAFKERIMAFLPYRADPATPPSILVDDAASPVRPSHP